MTEKREFTGGSTWNGEKFKPLEKEDFVFGEAFENDLKMAADQYDLLGSDELLRKLASAYGLKPEVTGEDVEDLAKMARAMDDEFGNGMEAKAFLEKRGADSELLGILYDRSELAKAGREIVPATSEREIPRVVGVPVEEDEFKDVVKGVPPAVEEGVVVGGSEPATPEAVEPEATEPVWYEELSEELGQASAYVNEFKDKKKTVRKEQSVIDALYAKRDEAEESLEHRGVNISILGEKGGRRQVSEARQVLFEGADVKSGMTEDEAKEILKGMNVNTERVMEERGKRIPTESKVEASKTGEPKETKKKETFNVTTEAELITELARINTIGDPSAKARRLGKLADYLFDKGLYELGNLAADSRVAAADEVRKKEESKRRAEILDNIEGIPEAAERDSHRAWREWSRARLTRVLSNGGRVDRGPSGIFSAVMQDTQFGRGIQNIDGSLYMRDFADKVYDEVMGKTDKTGAVELVGLVENVQELGELYKEWRASHTSIKALYEAMERKSYKLPPSDINMAFLNKLKSEDGTEEDGGSKNIAAAVRIYWAMAHSGDKGEDLATGREAISILDSVGLRGTILFDSVKGEYRSIYNDNKLSDNDVDKIRKHISGACGGTFYENLGFMYAGFFGISAYGSNSTLPGIRNVDGVGLLIHTESNFYKDEKERLSTTKRPSRFLPDMIANYLTERIKVSGDNDEMRTDRGVKVALELGPHPGNIQKQVGTQEPQYFYLVRRRGSGNKFETIKKIGVEDETGVPYAKNITEVDGWWKKNEARIKNGDYADENLPAYELDETKWEQVTMEQLIKEGRINELDWAESEANPFALMQYREGTAVTLWSLYKEMNDDLSKPMDVAERDKFIVDKKSVFNNPMPEYNSQTIRYAAYLWLHALIYKNSNNWLRDTDKKNNVTLTLQRALTLGLISKKQFNALNLEYKTGSEGGFIAPFQIMTKDIQRTISNITK